MFVKHEIDGRVGAIHVPSADLDGDGHPDFVALLAQHHEAVVAFLGDGKGGFRPHTLYAGPHPAWGSSGLSLVDLDRDGDLDVVACAFVQLGAPPGQPSDPRARAESEMPSLVWLEQVAPGRFEKHTLEVGRFHVTLDVADYDHDGDPDIVVGNFRSATGPLVEVWENLTRRPEEGSRR